MKLKQFKSVSQTNVFMQQFALAGKLMLLLLLLTSSSTAAQESGNRTKTDITNDIDELDIVITIIKENDQPAMIDQLISLPSISSQKGLKSHSSQADKANKKSEEARSNAQERVNNILGDPNLEGMPDILPADIRRVVPPRKPPKPPKPKK